MADIRESTPERPATDGAERPGTGTTARTRTSGVRLWLWRWVLTPRTTWQARRLAAASEPGVDADTAWKLARIARHPDERVYLTRRLDGEGVGGGTPAETRTR
ncbi:hypothetical protein OG204_00815 [Streptomyces sp. NBC_01387]|uniref:hypothetical protein n=1 Tax=unclassified Streptomyces TaxID=2593676 RepID=UPI002023C148|nr:MULTISPECIES: hypothetical protein [unclassified Streptomyces]MCX4553146.1 hypothetical protein [Streptomyces sp. NBC_01500]WSC24431.1 hypothetical protein OIE60_34840 [Streptomyces sp. NBC_01766]WSV58342.1 hypothetical protein OG282_34300 [Streptomyces sp. NBC_01014]